MQTLNGESVARFAMRQPQSGRHFLPASLRKHSRAGVALTVLLLSSLLLAACESSAASGDNATRYAFKGIVKSVNPPKRQATIKHEKVGDYMDAMTMPFLIKDEAALKQMRPSDSIKATLVVTKDGAQWLENIRIQRELAANSSQQEAQ